MLEGRHFFTHEDVQAVAFGVLGHRLILRPEAEIEGKHVADVVRDMLARRPGAGDRLSRATRSRPTAGDSPSRRRYSCSPPRRMVPDRRRPGARRRGVRHSRTTPSCPRFLGAHAPRLVRVRVGAVPHPLERGRVAASSVTRHVLQGGREVPMVWAGHRRSRCASRSRTPARSASRSRCSRTAARSRPSTSSGPTRTVHANLPAGEPVEIVYTLKTPSPGVLRFEGVKVRVADLHGFFYRRVFLRDPVEFLVLPPLTDDEGRQRATKRFNTLPPPGIHRLRRPGSGSELLDLRDYRPGDPPKMIAWKASARRDRLITKEFENDVPVRCVLFLDTSEGVRLGPPGNTLLTRMAGVAAAVAQASAGNRDLVGLTTFDEAEAKGDRTGADEDPHDQRAAPARGGVGAAAGVTGVPPEHLTRRAYPLAQELYPELMTKQVNSMPLGRLWIPLLDRKYGWIALAIIAINGLLVWLLRRLADLGARERRSDHTARCSGAGSGSSRSRVRLLGLVLHVLADRYSPGCSGSSTASAGGSASGRGNSRRRKQLCALFSLQDGTGPDGVERYIHDDEAYAVRVAPSSSTICFAARCRSTTIRAVTGSAAPGKAAGAGAGDDPRRGPARDNELFVVLADLAELGNDLAPVVKACRVARAGTTTSWSSSRGPRTCPRRTTQTQRLLPWRPTRSQPSSQRRRITAANSSIARRRKPRRRREAAAESLA